MSLSIIRRENSPVKAKPLRTPCHSPKHVYDPHSIPRIAVWNTQTPYILKPLATWAPRLPPELRSLAIWPAQTYRACQARSKRPLHLTSTSCTHAAPCSKRHLISTRTICSYALACSIVKTFAPPLPTLALLGPGERKQIHALACS